MTSTIEEVVNSSEEERASYSYRCPGCGELVDNREVDEVLEHHQHVLHPMLSPVWVHGPEGTDQLSPMATGNAGS
jgi:hypothetical protein